MCSKFNKLGFTLIELSIVLVVIGLVVAGVLVGQDLIESAKIRSQISQIEKFNTAANTFRLKYNYLPGDMLVTVAPQYGFARNLATTSCGSADMTMASCGNGDGIIGNNMGGARQFAEHHLFWRDLSDAGLIAESFAGPFNSSVNTTNVSSYLPPAKLGDGKYVLVWSGGVAPVSNSGIYSSNNGINYFSIAGLPSITGGWLFESYPTVKVIHAYNIDKKIDDGLPQSGRVTAVYVGKTGSQQWARWIGASTVAGAYGTPTTSALASSETTCYDNNNTAGVVQTYSVGQNGGNGNNCGISIQFQ